jgi:hypothetical protein
VRTTATFREPLGEIQSARALRARAGAVRDADIAAVLGLATLVELVQGGAELAGWAPDALLALAEFGSDKAPERVRKVAQNTLQNFFKAMQVDQQQWAKCKKLLTADQMQTLQELKGTQSYFS